MADRQGFFAIDRRSWAKVCDLGMPAAVVYVVLATGTGPDNATTSWSTHAVEKYTGVGRKRAKRAIDTLVEAGLVRRVRMGTRPAYRLVVWRRELSWNEEPVVKRLRAGKKLTASQEDRVPSLCEAGWLAPAAGDTFEVLDTAVPDWVWLPNSLVRPLSESDAPVERVRQSGDVELLRLFVDLYHAHDLCDDGGVSRQVIRGNWWRERVGQ